MNYTIEITRFEPKTDKHISSTEEIEASNYNVETHFTTFYSENQTNLASFQNNDIVSIKSEKK